ncbi:secreted RxLR effector protein 161-like [Solanum dulcamara]|uniref:secreted RxLR effector protein 161-like n=1 Tax=Solanum dulcamara TaxID=45834 RepID=UPI0024861CB9|nr:secreted RxLR effector protein 161-like [Solanum dulcamara]
MTRPYIAYAIHTLSQFMHCPNKSHMKATLRVVKYIKNALGLEVLMSAKQSNEIIGFCDADWAACPMYRRLVTNYVMKLGDSLIAWKSKKQTTMSRSSAEAEYRSMASGVSEILWLVDLCKELKVKVQLPVTLHNDSKLAIQITANPIFHERTKHIEIVLRFIKDKIHDGIIKTKYVTSKDQVANLFSKDLGKGQHDYLVGKLGMLNLFASTSLRGSVENEEG